MRIRVNGEDREVRDALGLLALVEDLGLDRRFLVVELNGEPLGRDELDGVVLTDGDRLELVRPVAGG